MFLVGVYCIFAGAMNYGAAGEVMPVVISCAGLIVATFHLIYLDKFRTRFAGRKRTVAPIALLLLALVAAILGLANLIVGQIDRSKDPLTSETISKQELNFQPPWTEKPKPETNTPNTKVDKQSNHQPPKTEKPKPETNTPNTKVVFDTRLATQEEKDPFSFLVKILLICLAITSFLICSRLCYVKIRLLAIRRRLKSRHAPDPVVPSWIWLTLNARRLGVQWLERTSVDRIDKAFSPDEVSEETAELLIKLSELTTKVIFARNHTISVDRASVWRMSSELVRGFTQAAPWRRRVSALLRKVAD